MLSLKQTIVGPPLKHILGLYTEDCGEPERKYEGRGILSRFERDYCLACYTYAICQLLLRDLSVVEPELANAVLELGDFRGRHRWHSACIALGVATDCVTENTMKPTHTKKGKKPTGTVV